MSIIIIIVLLRHLGIGLAGVGEMHGWSVYIQPSVLTPTMKLMAAEFGYHWYNTAAVIIYGSGWYADPNLSNHGIFRDSDVPRNRLQYELGC